MTGTILYNDERRTRYGALFGDNLLRFGSFQGVTCARRDHQQLASHEMAAPHSKLVHATCSRTVPLIGIDFGNEFGRGNETYFNVSQHYRPARYFDLASPFSRFAAVNHPATTRYLTGEAGVHGWPEIVLFDETSVVQVDAPHEIGTEQLTQTETRDVNSGDLRSRDIEASMSYDLLRLRPAEPRSRHLAVFVNPGILNAEITSSRFPGQVGKVPAYAPHDVGKGGLTMPGVRGLKLGLTVDSVGAQYLQSSDTELGTTPALMPAYAVADLTRQYSWGKHWRGAGGVTRFGNRRYHSRVFLSGGIFEPALTRQLFAGISYHFRAMDLSARAGRGILPRVGTVMCRGRGHDSRQHGPAGRSRDRPPVSRPLVAAGDERRGAFGR